MSIFAEGRQRVDRANVARLNDAVGRDLSGGLAKPDDPLVVEHEKLRGDFRAVCGTDARGAIDLHGQRPELPLQEVRHG